MQNDCEIFVDPEEDEVFFGCMSEREKIVSAKLVKPEEPDSKDCEFHNVLNHVTNSKDENNENDVKNEESANEEAIPKGVNESPDRTNDSVTILSNSSNTSVELEHNYSTPMKHKIDKSILTTPKSVVKADRDGGFLKVLSEIALVKAEAEAEGDTESEEKKEDEDKENKECKEKKTKPVPEIRVTEATPEKVNFVSPPKSVRREIRRFRIIYNSPQNDGNIEYKSNSFETERNIKNKCLDEEPTEKMINSNEKRKSIDLIDLNDSVILLESEEKEKAKDNPKENAENKEEVIPTEESKNGETNKTGNEDVMESGQPTKGLRFSKEARKVVEFLKTSTADDTLNFTIPEIDVDNEENSFLNPETVSLEDTVLPGKSVAVRTPIVVRSAEEKLERPKTVEKERRKLTPLVSRSRLQPLKYYSDRRVNKMAGEVTNCVKKLSMEEKKAVEKVNGVSGDGGGDYKTSTTSKIPVFGSKNVKVGGGDRLGRPLTSKTTPMKTPSGKSYKNSKFNHIESPINAYIHNKPTSLVQNVKPEVKKDLQGLSRIWKAQATVGGNKVEGKTTNVATRLPFVEYKSGTPYKIEKRTESRLPRLAPNVLKLIGSHSPKVLKHEGRFYVKTPRKQPSVENNSTVVADQNEVSVVVSQPALKSHTFK